MCIRDSNQAGPNFPGTWRVQASASAPIDGELAARDALDLFRANESNYGLTRCSVSNGGRALCQNGQLSNLRELEDFSANPLSQGLREAHDIILKAPRS